MTDPCKQRTRWPKAGVSLPPIKVESTLLDRVHTIAETELRSLSDVLRCAIRDGLDHRDRAPSRKKAKAVAK